MEVLVLVSISIRSLSPRSVPWLYFSELLIVHWFSSMAPIVTFPDTSGMSMVLMGGAALTLSAFSRKYSIQYRSPTLRNLAIITQGYSYCGVMGMLLVPSSYFHTDLFFMSLFVGFSRYFEPFAMLPFSWQDDFRCAYQFSFTFLLYCLVPYPPPLAQEAGIEPRLRLSYIVFFGVQLVTFAWLQFRSSFKSLSIIPPNPWYSLIACLVFIGLNLIWFGPYYCAKRRKQEQSPLNQGLNDPIESEN